MLRAAAAGLAIAVALGGAGGVYVAAEGIAVQRHVKPRPVKEVKDPGCCARHGGLCARVCETGDTGAA